MILVNSTVEFFEMRLIIRILGVILLFPIDALAQKAEMFNLEKLYDPQVSNGDFVSWKNDGILIPIRYESKTSERVEVSFSGLDADFQLYLLHEVLADFSAGNCGTTKKNRTFEEVMVPDRAEQKPDLTFDADGQNQWLLVRVKPKSNSRSGKYPFVICFSQKTNEVEVKGHLTVKNKILKDSDQIDFYSDFWQFPLNVADYHNLKPWSEEHWQKIEKMFEMLSQINQQSITTSVFWDLYNSRLRPLDEMMIQVTKTTSGEFKYDFSIFEKFVELGIANGVSQQISVHNLFPWNQRHFYFDEKSQQIKSVTAAPGSAAYQDFWKPFLLEFSAFLREKNWLSKTVFFIDEKDANQSMMLINWVKEVDQKFNFGFSGRFSPAISTAVGNYSVPMNVVIDPKYLRERVSANKFTSLYTSCFEKANQPNMLLTSDYRDTYFLVFLAKAKGYNGILRWAFNKWSSQINTNAIYADVPSGDAHFIYPDGHVSTRYLVLQDAFEEVAKLEAKDNDKQSREMFASLTRYFLINIEKDRFATVQSMKNYLND